LLPKERGSEGQQPAEVLDAGKANLSSNVVFFGAP
jgi:hypothetical protein